MTTEPAFQLLGRSASYLTAARICAQNGGNTALLRAPILHLVAHGIEVLLKHIQVLSGKTPEKVRMEFGHDILRLWNDDLAGELRGVARRESISAWEVAKRKEKFDDDFADEPFELLNQNLCALSSLHNCETDFALRYILSPDQHGPNPLLLIDTFLPVKDEFIRRYSRI